MDLNFDEIVNDTLSNMHVNVGNLLLTNNQIMVLKKYNIEYLKCSSMSELSFEIEEYLNNEMIDDCDDLELISFEISEINYYMNTNK